MNELVLSRSLSPQGRWCCSALAYYIEVFGESASFFFLFSHSCLLVLEIAALGVEYACTLLTAVRACTGGGTCKP